MEAAFKLLCARLEWSMTGGSDHTKNSLNCTLYNIIAVHWKGHCEEYNIIVPLILLWDKHVLVIELVAVSKLGGRRGGGGRCAQPPVFNTNILYYHPKVVTAS